MATRVRFWTEEADYEACMGDPSITGFQVQREDRTWRPAKTGTSLADVKRWMESQGYAITDSSPVTSDIRTGEMFVMLTLA